LGRIDTTPAYALELVSEEVEVEAGREAAAEVEQEWGGVLYERRMTGRVQRVGRRIVSVCQRRHLPFTFKVLDNAEMANACALPGGPVYITLRLVQMCDNDDELAAILGHEVAHTDREHGRQAISREVAIKRKLGELLGEEHDVIVEIGTAVASTLITLGYSQEQEREADKWGVRLMRQAGFDPHGALTILRKMNTGEEEPEGLEKYLQTHPPTSERIAAISQQIKEEEQGSKGAGKRRNRGTRKAEEQGTAQPPAPPTPTPKPQKKPGTSAGKQPSAPPPSAPAVHRSAAAQRAKSSRISPIAYLFFGLATLAFGGSLYFWYATRPRFMVQPVIQPKPGLTAWLDVVSSTGDRRRYSLAENGSMKIGRVPAADLCLDDEQVSRLHVQITRTGETFTVADLGSTNGTLVNGQRVSRAPLRDGDRIQIGRTVLTFRQGIERGEVVRW